MGILTKNSYGVEVVSLFNNGITIDTKLPKWVNSAKRLESLRKEKNKQNNSLVYEEEDEDTPIGDRLYNNSNNFNIYGTPEHYQLKDDVNFDEIALANLKELTDIIKNGELNNVLSGYGGMHQSNNFQDTSVGPVPIRVNENGKIKSFFRRVKNNITNWINRPEFDALKFFTFVKLATKESAMDYRDRVQNYLRAIHNANMVGQTALLEKLLSEMIANKYEALLFSTGQYHVITEEQLINFASKSERGISLTYVKNYAKPIPNDVIEKVAKANELEVYDNYVILHYDPKGVEKRETKKEDAKRRDPIIFGVIAGSNKLYYVADWIDEHCDLTLEKFVDTLGVTKESLLEGRVVPEKEKETDKTKKRTAAKTTKKKGEDKK